MQFPCQKNFLEKTDQNWHKDLQLTPTQMLQKLTNWKWFLGPIALKYVPKEFSKVNTCARDPPWCYKNTQYSRQHWSVTHANLEWYILTVSQQRHARLIFKLWCHVTISSWIKIFILASLRTSLYGCDLIHEWLYTLLHFSSQQRNEFLYFLSHWQQLHKNVESNIEQILATTPHETPTVQPLASNHKNYTG